MDLIEFKDLPDTSTPINAENLNNNFNKLKDNIYEIYSTEEVKTCSTWIDGKPIYRKVIEIDSLPNDTEITYEHNISNFGQLTRFYCHWYDTDDSRWFYGIRYDRSDVFIKIIPGSSDIKIEAKGVDWSARTNSFAAIIEYTKTTD